MGPDAIYVSDQPLPTNGGKIANKTLRTPEFRQGALADELMKARRKLQDEAPGLQPGCTSDEEALVDRLFGEEGPLSMDKSKILFGDCSRLALQALLASDTDAAEQVKKGDLLKLLRVMTVEERSSFVLAASSLLGNWAEGKIA